MPGKVTTDAIFMVHYLQKHIAAAKKQLYLAFVDLEKAFNRAPRKVLWWALRNLDVDELAVIQGHVPQCLEPCAGQWLIQWELVCIRALSSAHRSSFWCWKRCCVKLCTGVPWERLYADDLVLIAYTQEECISKRKAWKARMESKGLCASMKKTQVYGLRSGVDLDVLKKSGKYPCAVCCKSCSNNSTECLQCKLWVHKKRSGIMGRLVADWNSCPRTRSPLRGHIFLSRALLTCYCQDYRLLLPKLV